MVNPLERLQSLWGASTQRGQIFFVAEFFGQRQFVALNPPVACRHSEPHEVTEAYTFEESERGSRIWGPEPEYLYAPAPGTVAPILTVPDSQVLIYNINNCRPEPASFPLPEPTWMLYDGDGFSYWLPYRHKPITLAEFRQE